MRMKIGFWAIAATIFFTATPSMASEGKDRVYADSFGNLVIHSSTGYKRIIVGKGDVAKTYQDTGSYYEPENVQPRPVARRCSRPPHVWHGRSHMYGLSNGEIPQAPLICR